MNISVNVDCSPEEARSFLGLPDVTPIHDKYIKTMLEAMEGTVSIDQMENLVRSFSPMGDASMRLFKQMMDLGLSSAGFNKQEEKQ